MSKKKPSICLLDGLRIDAPALRRQAKSLGRVIDRNTHADVSPSGEIADLESIWSLVHAILDKADSAELSWAPD